jgi:hypothetical protein
VVHTPQYNDFASSDLLLCACWALSFAAAWGRYGMEDYVGGQLACAYENHQSGITCKTRSDGSADQEAANASGPPRPEFDDTTNPGLGGAPKGQLTEITPQTLRQGLNQSAATNRTASERVRAGERPAVPTALHSQPRETLTPPPARLRLWLRRAATAAHQYCPA